jgi:L-ribulose-5-phosphate 4-epimerase
MLESLKEQVWEANEKLPKYGLVTFTWGNVSGIDRESGLFVIKPSGVPYEDLRPEDMVVMDLDGSQVEGQLRPSSDTKTHLELYKAFPQLGGVVHTHSTYATGFAQAGLPIACMGTTQCDYFYGDIPCVRNLTPEEIAEDYEKNTGTAIVNWFRDHDIDPGFVPGCLAKNHGPFVWGKDPAEAVRNAAVVEEVAKMDFIALTLDPRAGNVPMHYLEKHFQRKHGPHAYYGQENRK